MMLVIISVSLAQLILVFIVRKMRLRKDTFEPITMIFNIMNYNMEIPLLLKIAKNSDLIIEKFLSTTVELFVLRGG